ncbi:MBL fold metallo-hydrolase [Candidatus Pacearchaeota archaeon]|nr:MBL fold metallo-hydrolase [Candidatus Pacearchaeota archaeon]
MIKIHPVGGADEVGKFMTIVEVGDDAFVFDMGLYMPALVSRAERNGALTEKILRAMGALPDDLSVKEELRNKIRGILIGHAHLDHIGAVPYIEHRYNAGIYGTPFTMAVLDELVKDSKISLKNRTNSVQPDTSVLVRGKHKEYEVEFINMTHSTLQTAVIAVHTPKGIVAYANDFKMDDTPVMGGKPNYGALKRLAGEGVKVLIVDSLYAKSEGKTPSEEEARKMLRHVMLNEDNKGKGMIVTTFSSHIPRLKSIVEFGKKLNREIVFLGRSLNKYTNAARRVNQCPYDKDIKIVTYRNQVFKFLKKAAQSKKDYLIVCTGHQGEPGSVLERISRGELPYKLSPKDHIIFSSRTIPTPETIASKEAILKRLYKSGAEIFEDVHVSGHGHKEDLRELIKLLRPEHIIPSHGHQGIVSQIIPLVQEMGYEKGRTVHLLENGKALELK